MGTRAGELPLIYYEILGADRLAREVALENLARTTGGPCPCRQRAARDMWRPAVVRDGGARMILGRRLREPDVARVACKLSAFERPHDRVAVANFTAGGVHDITAALHHAD